MLEILNATGLIRVHVSEYQGKIHAGWRMPPNTPFGIEFNMRKLVELEIEELRASVIARRRSDSIPNELREELMTYEENQEMRVRE